MTLQELNDNIKLHERLDRAYDMAQSLREKADLQAPVVDGLPHGTDVSDKVGNIAIAIADLDERINDLEDQLYLADDKVRRFANSFEDERVQAAIQLRYISGFTWEIVAELLGSEYTDDALRRLVYRSICGRP